MVSPNRPTTPTSPRAFLRARRPAQFSDSENELGSPALDRGLLEYHLDTLTSRNQEAAFAEFARQLAQRELCPNLLPQTGPTGGGDSKVDSETYPVADSLTYAWYVGVGSAAATERWAFAFSAMKAWRPKLASDIAKLVAAGRGYTKAFFITNQFVSDKKRAQAEDSLRKKHGLDVRVLDRNWILDRVFAGGHQALAASVLNIDVPLRDVRRKGPVDTRREQDLADGEARIAAAIQNGAHRPALVSDCIDASLLARGLERPRAVVEGLLDRAIRCATDFGTHHQRVVATYNKAWTLFWWYEDYAAFNRVYGEVEALVKRSENPHELELLANLWFLLAGRVSAGEMDEKTALLDERTSVLTKDLKRVAAEHDRPSAALEARTRLLFAEFARPARRDPEQVLRELEAVLQESEGLVGYPFETNAQLIKEVAVLVGDTPAYQHLFEIVADLMARRAGEIAGARMWVSRGLQQMNAGQPYEAIRSCGRALVSLHKDETRREAVRALYVCGAAYERVCLFWAARAALLRGAVLAIDEFWKYEDVTPEQVACCARLKWLELELGRVPAALAWHEAHSALAGALRARTPGEQDDDSSVQAFDVAFGLLMLRADVWALKKATRLPDVLMKQRLPLASTALLYALGHEDEAVGAESGATPEDLAGDMRRWRDASGSEDLPSGPDWGDEQHVTLRSVVLGCRIVVDSINDARCRGVAELLLSAIEGFMATGLADGGVARLSELQVVVRPSDIVEGPFGFEIEEVAGVPRVVVRCGNTSDTGALARAQALDRAVVDLVASVAGRMSFAWRRGPKELQKLIVEERAMARATYAATSRLSLSNVLGSHPRETLDDWTGDDGLREYPLRRTEEWDADERRARLTSPTPDEGPLRPATGEPPEGFPDIQRMKHGDISVVSAIREPLWDEAKWRGVLFETGAGEYVGRRYPVMALGFERKAPAALIFEHWRREFGREDDRDGLGVSIVRRVLARSPAIYRVVVGTNFETAIRDGRSQGLRNVVGMCRVQTMTPDSEANLERFINAYRQVGAYVLTFAGLDDPDGPPSREDYILKRKISIRDAWEIGPNDFETAGVLPDDDPLIPAEHQTDAPVLALLRRKRRR